MELLYKPDWDATRMRYRAWWQHKYFGRCGLAVTAPKKMSCKGRPPRKARTIKEQWYDLELINQWQHYRMAGTYYGGEALPIWNAGYPGNAAIPTFLGCPLSLDRETGWWDPILTGDAPDFRQLKINRTCADYRFAMDTLRCGAEWVKGKCLLTTGAFGGCGDTLAALRTTNQLLYDCMDRPDWVQAAEEYLMDMWCEHYRVLYDQVHEVNGGSTGWFPLWAPGKFYAVQNDFSYMIAPGMFRDLCIPALRKQTEFLDYSVYHVDGIMAFVHVDALCELPRLQALQILPGAGKPSPLHYLEVLKKVQRYGKNLHISIGPGEVKYALENLSARGLFIDTWCATEEEARALLGNAEKWSVDRG